MTHRPVIAAVIAIELIVLTTFCPVSFAQDQSQALIEAAKKGDLEQVRDLLDKGADINATDTCGGTPLLWASVKGNTEIVKVLLAKGADTNARGNEGRTALMFASVEGHAEVVKVLLGKAADINAKDNKGWNALMWASSMSRAEVVKALLAKGADVNAEGKHGLTALKLALQNNHLEVVKLLKAHGAKETYESKWLSDFDMWSISLLLFIAFALLVFCRIARNRWMRWIFLLLGLAVWYVVASWSLMPRNDGAFGVVFGFVPLCGAVADLIAIPILRRRVMPPCVRVRRTPIYRSANSFFWIAIGIFCAIQTLNSPKMMIFWALFTASTIIYLYNTLSERVEVCANGVSQYQRLRPWEQYESFSWGRKTKYGVELWLVPKSWRSWIYPSQRLLVAPEDREAVQQILEANLPDRSTAPGA